VTRRDSGTVLMLFPAAVLVTLVLAAISLDLGWAHVRSQQLRYVAASAANDAIGALDIDELRNTGKVQFDMRMARQIVDSAIAAGPVAQAELDSVTVQKISPKRFEITVKLHARVDFIIAPSIPGAASSIEVAVTERAVAVL